MPSVPYSVVEWLDQDGQPLSSKKMVLVHKNIGLFPGETAVAYQRDHDLAMATRKVHIRIARPVIGSEGNLRPKGGAGCLELDSELDDRRQFALTAEKSVQSGFVQTDVFSIRNDGNDQQSLYASPIYYDKDGRLMTKPSTPTLLNKKALASTLLPIFRTGETRFFYLSTFMSKLQRDKVGKVCVRLSRELN